MMDRLSRTQFATIGAVAERTGINVETIRYYERIELLPTPARSASGYRQYDEANVARLAFIRRSRQLGFSLAEIRDLLQLADGGGEICAAVEAITARHLDDVRRKIRTFRKIERALRDMVGQCASTLPPQCPIIEALRGDG